MRYLAVAVIFCAFSVSGHAAYLTDVNPNDDANWVPVTVEVPPEFGTLSYLGAHTVFPDTDNKYATVVIPTAPYRFWLRRAADPHPGHPTFWVDIQLWLAGSPIGGGMNYLLLERDEATAAALVLRPKPELYPPMTPPNDRVGWSRFWTVDDGSPRDALAPTQFKLVPEPSAVLIAAAASVVGLIVLRRRGT